MLNCTSGLNVYSLIAVSDEDLSFLMNMYVDLLHTLHSIVVILFIVLFGVLDLFKGAVSPHLC